MKAIWNNTVIAESSDTIVVESNHYFPRPSVKDEHIQECDRTTTCPWKGTANYFDIVVGNDTNHAAAWYYSTPLDAAKNIKDHVAFWRGVTVVE